MKQSYEACVDRFEAALKLVKTDRMKKDDIEDFFIETNRARAMMYGYFNKYQPTLSNYKTIYSEKKTEIDLGHGRIYDGKFDRIVQEMDDEWWVLETKTSAKMVISPDYIRSIAINNQVLGYILTAQNTLGIQIRGVIWDVIVKTQHRQTQKESPAGFVNRLKNMYMDPKENEGLYFREKVIISPKEVERFKNQAAFTLDMMRTCRDAKMYPMNSNNCIGKYGSCVFMPICLTKKIDDSIYTKRDD
jgi:NAD-dependent dihydropyrimidine dehydrogenase PreA subunit